MKQLMLDKGKKLIREKLADYIAALKEGKGSSDTNYCPRPKVLKSF
jgi:hypothetical protein